MISREDVESSNICSIGYDPETRILEIEFGKDGYIGDSQNRLYRYHDVPPETYEELMKSPSLGKYHNHQIAYQYKYDYLGHLSDLEE